MLSRAGTGNWAALAPVFSSAPSLSASLSARGASDEIEWNSETLGEERAQGQLSTSLPARLKYPRPGSVSLGSQSLEDM